MSGLENDALEATAAQEELKHSVKIRRGRQTRQTILFLNPSSSVLLKRHATAVDSLAMPSQPSSYAGHVALHVTCGSPVGRYFSI